MKGSVFLLVFVGTLAACAGILNIDDLPVAPEADSADVRAEDRRADQFGSKGDSACNLDPPKQITFSGHPVSPSAIDLRFTKGPRYTLKRKVTQGHDTGNEDAWVVLGSPLPPCSSTFHDNGEDAVGVFGVEGGLTANWQYSYELTVLLPNGDVDPAFPVLALTLQTWPKPGIPNDDDASVTVSAGED